MVLDQRPKETGENNATKGRNCIRRHEYNYSGKIRTNSMGLKVMRRRRFDLVGSGSQSHKNQKRVEGDIGSKWGNGI